MQNSIQPHSSEDLQSWKIDLLHTREVTEHPSEGEAFKKLDFDWPLEVLESGPLFIRFETALPE